MRIDFTSIDRFSRAAVYFRKALENSQLSLVQNKLAVAAGYRDFFDLQRNGLKPTTFAENTSLSKDLIYFQYAAFTEIIAESFNISMDVAFKLLVGSHLLGEQRPETTFTERVAGALRTRHLAKWFEFNSCNTDEVIERYLHEFSGSIDLKNSLNDVIERCPMLHAAGYGTMRDFNSVTRRVESYPNTEKLTTHRKELNNLILPVSACLEYLKCALSVRNIPAENKNSYGLKHDVERYFGIYIPNGAFIAAAIIAGFEKSPGYNPEFNIARNSIPDKQQYFYTAEGRRITGKRHSSSNDRRNPREYIGKMIDLNHPFALYNEDIPEGVSFSNWKNTITLSPGRNSPIDTIPI
jgi:hypothetical protein